VKYLRRSNSASPLGVRETERTMADIVGAMTERLLVDAGIGAGMRVAFPVVVLALPTLALGWRDFALIGISL